MATYAAYRHIELDKVGAGKKRDDHSTSSDSEDDEDYVPSAKDDPEASEERTDDSEDEEGGGWPAAKRGRTRGRRKKRVRLADRSAGEEEAPQERAEPSEKSAPANIDDLWNEFKKDVRPVPPAAGKAATVAAAAATADQSDAPVGGSGEQPAGDDGPPPTKTVTEIFEFAGEAVEVRKEVPAEAAVAAAAVPQSRSRGGGAGGLSSVLGQIGKKQKLSVLEKSKLDWDTFKRAEGIQEQLQTHNRGKEGYLEKQDFLQRTDLRQFELEKAMRSNSRRAK